MTTGNEIAVLSRIIEPENPRLPAPVAGMILGWKFAESDRERMHALLEKAKSGKLTRQEKADANGYERLGHFLSILKSKARGSLKAKGAGSQPK